MTVRVTFFGSGNAFADGGRAHASIHVSAPGTSLLLDCGGASLPAITRHIGLDTIDAVAVTHLHGDHFGGIPFVLDQQRWTYRKRPLLLAGPPSLRERLGLLARGYGMDITNAGLGYDLSFLTLGHEEQAIGSARVAAFPVRHSPAAEPHGLRVRIDGKLIAYTGDTTWSEELVALADGADLFICESTYYESADPVHVSYTVLRQHRGDLRCKRMVLTHLGADMLEHLDKVDLEVAHDGMAIEL